MGYLVEQCGEHLILQMGRRGNGNYIVYNRHKPWKGGHTHIRGISECYECIKDVRDKRIPENKSGYLLESRARISRDEEYIRQCRELARAKRQEVDTDGRGKQG